MDEQIVLTVSIAAYNVDKFLKESISSLICNRVIEKIEIIVVNDGSTDNTKLIAQKCRDEYGATIKIIDKKNGGYGSTINCSSNVARGKYFKQLDGDDWYLNDNLEEFVDYLETVDSDLVITPFVKYYEASGKFEVIDIHRGIPDTPTFLNKVAFNGNLAMHELAIKTDLMKEISITEHCFYTDNEYTFFPLLKAVSVSYFEKPIYVYRIGREGQSVSLSGARKHYKDTMIVAKSMIYELMKYRDKWGLNIITIKIKYIIDAVYTYFLCSDSPGAVNELKKFDSWLKTQHKNIYIATNSVKKIAILRATRFIPSKWLGKRLSSNWK